MGLAIAAVAVLAPAWRDLRASTVAASRAELRAAADPPPSASSTRPGPATGGDRAPLWARYGLDLALLAASGLVFWASSRNGYQLVVAPEGVPTISVSYWAFAGPALLWAGGGLLAWRLVDLLLRRGRGGPDRPAVALHGHPGIHHRVADLPAPPAAHPCHRAARARARVRRLHRHVQRHYRAQAEVDAQLTNGADVTVTPSPGAGVGPAAGAAFGGVAGVRAVEPIQHRFAYVGTDLQDLYGVNPATITHATSVTDQYFQGGTARDLLGRLAAAPDSILVSAETVTDFQLHPGDQINLRLPDARTGGQVMVPFHYAGVVTEFPTAPKDSFLVANASYVAAATGSDAPSCTASPPRRLCCSPAAGSSPAPPSGGR